MLIDFDLRDISDLELRHATTAARALAHFGATREVPGLARIATSLAGTLTAECVGRDAGRGKGNTVLTVDALEDAPPEDAIRGRQAFIGYACAVVRNDPDELDAVRRLYGHLAADLAEPSEASRAIELARLGALT